MPFPLYRCPGGVAFLDDDEAWLEMLAEVMPARWPVSLHLHPSSCIQQLQQQATRQDADDWQQRDMLDRWRDGQPLIPQILRYWHGDAMARHTLTRVCVVDYSMPAMSGLQVLAQISPWQGSRILLTGRADEQIAVDAFNAGLIEQYIPKQNRDIARHLTEAIQRRLDQPRAEQALTWRATLSREQSGWLNPAGVSQPLLGWMATLGLVEHIVIGDPFGILALDADGQACWLQLEPEDRLAELAELAVCHRLDPAGVQAIRNGRQLVNIELCQSLGRESVQWAPAVPFGDGAALLVAAFRLPEELCPGRERSYNHFLQTSGPRVPMELSALP